MAHVKAAACDTYSGPGTEQAVTGTLNAWPGLVCRSSQMW